MQVDKKNGSICYNDDAHVYWDGDTNKKYISVTTLLEKYIPPYDKEFWSLYKAIQRMLTTDEFNMEKKRLLETHKIDLKYFESMYSLSEYDILTEQQNILDEWVATNKQSTERGTKIHSELENSFYKSEKCQLKKFGISGDFVCKKDYFNLDLENGVYPEFLVYYQSPDGNLCLAGQIDLLIKKGNSIWIFDYKTNKELKFKSFYDYRVKKAQMMKYPLNGLMDCNFMHYTMQLSTYAWMIQKMNPDFIIEKLTLIHYDHSDKVSTHEIEYRKTDVEKVLKDFDKKMIKEQQEQKRKRFEY